MSPLLQRHQMVARLRWRLERQSFPRLQMVLLVSLTGAAGFIASFMLLRLGLTEMWLRYLAAFSFAYLAFLGLLWLWLRTRAEDFVDIPDVSGMSPTHSGMHDSSNFVGGGGSGGGGGASGSFDSSISAEPVDARDDAVGEALDSVGDVVSGADEFALPLVALILVGALLLSSFWIVYSAPVLFAELLVDGMLAASLYRRLRGLDSQHWLETALKRTLWPFAATGLLVSAMGWAMQAYAPEAHSLGQVIKHIKDVEKI